MSLESHDTLKGRLQRGHGAAFLEVVARRDEAGIRDLVIDTVLATEGSGTPLEMDSYYANLLLKADIDPAPLYRAIQSLNRRSEMDADTLPFMVVCNLAVSGVPAAMDVALWYVSRGMWWPHALDILAPGGSDARAPGLMNTLLARFPTTRLLVRNRVCCQKVTSSWRGRDRRIDAALDAHPYFHHWKGPQPPPVLNHLSTRELLHEARWAEGSWRWEELGRRTSPDDRRLMIEALSLPPVPLRTLFEGTDAHGIGHSDTEIDGWLRHELRNPAYPHTDNVLVRLLPLYEGFPGTEPYPELAEMFRRVSTGKDRYQVCKAIAATDPAFGTTLAIDCLWDASQAVRSVAVEKVTMGNATAIQRLQEIAADPLEHPWNARTAESRLNDPRL